MKQTEAMPADGAMQFRTGFALSDQDFQGFAVQRIVRFKFTDAQACCGHAAASFWWRQCALAGCIPSPPIWGQFCCPRMGVVNWGCVEVGCIRVVESWMDTIETHIAKDREQLARAEAGGDQAKVRHYATELEGLETYRSHHPGDHKDPTSLEVHCDLNPDAPECRVYDD